MLRNIPKTGNHGGNELRHSFEAIAKFRNAPGDDDEIVFLLIYQCVMIQNKNKCFIRFDNRAFLLLQ